ncbi:hypothetical protein [Kaistia defluvii]|uniref:hypothetical protein n=1 Tax=Kaistia defluvii TaxID=410841 RepID=UPI003898F645
MLVAPMLASTPAYAYRSGGAACGPRGCAAAGCGPRGCAAGAARPGYRAPGYRPRGVVVVNPHRYWRPGGAIAAGAAIGFIAGAAAVSLAGTPPKPGYCWYYTTPNRTSGFWDVCPR